MEGSRRRKLEKSSCSGHSFVGFQPDAVQCAYSLLFLATRWNRTVTLLSAPSTCQSDSWDASCHDHVPLHGKKPLAVWDVPSTDKLLTSGFVGCCIASAHKQRLERSLTLWMEPTFPRGSPALNIYDGRATIWERQSQKGPRRSQTNCFPCEKCSEARVILA